MNAFARAHLAHWADVNVYPDEREAFIAWVGALDAEDLAHYQDAGWSATFRAFTAGSAS